MANSQQQSLISFEENYLQRTLGNIVKKPDVAIMELVANAWDAGASVVEITIPHPHKPDEKIISISDNGEGLTDSEFKSRWMKLGYDRIRNQGSNVPDVNNIGINRKTYGKNGQGRHGILCFNSSYTVTTSKNGIRKTYHIGTSGENALTIESESEDELVDVNEHGTKVFTEVVENLPKIDDISKKLSGKFLFDSSFVIKINGESIDLEKEFDAIRNTTLSIASKINLDISLIDTEKVKTKLDARGIAIWQENRLVGKPSWVLGDKQVIDSRTRFGLRFMVVVKTRDLEDYILPDWSGFKDDALIDRVFTEICSTVESWFDELSQESMGEQIKQINSTFRKEIAGLSRLSKRDVETYTQSILRNTYGLVPKKRDAIIASFIKLQETNSGIELLQKLLLLDEGDIAGLNKLLDNWKVTDALAALDIIDFRLKVIETIKRYSGDDKIDELHVIHPLITEARWLFGPEYESSEYIFNSTLRTVVKRVYGKDLGKDAFVNDKKRPDLLVLPNNEHISITGIEDFYSTSSLAYTRRILLIELKKGGFTITEKELEQIQHYVRGLKNQKEIEHTERIEGYLVGSSISKDLSTDPKIDGNSVIHITTYSQLVDTANKRLVALHKILSERYDTMDDKDLHKGIAGVIIPDQTTLISDKNE